MLDINLTGVWHGSTAGLPRPRAHRDDRERLQRTDLPPGPGEPTFDDATDALAHINMWPGPYLEVDDVANAVLFLAGDEARYITGVALPIDLGMSQK